MISMTLYCICKVIFIDEEEGMDLDDELEEGEEMFEEEEDFLWGVEPELEVVQILNSVALVCKTFYSLANNDCIWAQHVRNIIQDHHLIARFQRVKHQNPFSRSKILFILILLLSLV